MKNCEMCEILCVMLKYKYKNNQEHDKQNNNKHSPVFFRIRRTCHCSIPNIQNRERERGICGSVTKRLQNKHVTRSIIYHRNDKKRLSL